MRWGRTECFALIEFSGYLGICHFTSPTNLILCFWNMQETLWETKNASQLRNTSNDSQLRTWLIWPLLWGPTQLGNYKPKQCQLMMMMMMMMLAMMAGCGQDCPPFIICQKHKNSSPGNPFGARAMATPQWWWFGGGGFANCIFWNTLLGINISHLGKRKIIFKMPFFGGIC